MNFFLQSLFSAIFLTMLMVFCRQNRIGNNLGIPLNENSLIVGTLITFVICFFCIDVVCLLVEKKKIAGAFIL